MNKPARNTLSLVAIALLAAAVLAACGPGGKAKGPAPAAPAATEAKTAQPPVLAPLPPMGFNTWNKFGCDVDEKLIRETADAMVETGMLEAGYKYLVIDDCWQVDRAADGRIIADPQRFPSGMKALADYVHGKGLLFGIYSDIGPKTCAGRPGAAGHFDLDAATYAEWGVDYIKVDWCNCDDLDAPAEYARFRGALDRAGRPIVLSICEWGRNDPWTWAKGVGQLWRTTADIGDNWASVVWIIGANSRLADAAGPGHWNDPDMLEVGNGGMTFDEYKTHFSLWAVMAAPLMAGNDLRAMSAETRSILLNKEVIAVDQDPLGVQGRVIIERGYGGQVWMKPLADGSRAVAFVNYSDRELAQYVRWAQIGIPAGPAKVRDLWAREDMGVHSDTGKHYNERFEVKVPSHGVVLVRIWPGA
ncbi:MAG TPA: glycoside hydrolase family 27 protein [Candidatus Aminicenantes bacterium]|nr:glycoside hydrolase family 27 protein [Candidatus Aminicenantes bacterium]HRY64005.1 glycoside hydrolase family 27 protein [Candidatus Aminicenantes bacterium]HRZ70918.1 glycoside hydrolase family 27 protein [Candidatus Aminicenantes bacterium]